MHLEKEIESIDNIINKLDEDRTNEEREYNPNLKESLKKLEEIIKLLRDNGFDISDHAISEEMILNSSDSGLEIATDRHLKIKAHYYKNIGLRISSSYNSEYGELRNLDLKNILEENKFSNILQSVK